MQQTQKRRTARFSTRWVRRAAFGLAVGVSLMLAPTLGQAQSAGLSIELNKAEDIEGGCVASFLFQNNLGPTLDRFNLDLFLFDAEGVIVRRVTIDLAPLLNGKTRVAQFHLHNGACRDISRILVNDIPQCRAESGETVDCLAGLAVSSRSQIALDK